MSHQSPLLQILSDYKQQTDGKCGLLAVHLAERTGKTYAEMRVELGDLFRAGEIEVRDGIQGKLIFKKEASNQ